ncbi:MAG: MgtC/SapB family protein [Thioalkalispiraceae bacterium]|jgi:putative Mg2+ transporter-C (MgtC) family protein
MLNEVTITETGPILGRLLWALLAGCVIGLERSVHGRPAGLRTHALVCMSSSLLMLLTVYQWELLKGMPLETIRVDPTRMAQGVMTGIGFLGAGVIMKEKLTIRGLTTAASIWMTAAIGIIIGMGFLMPALYATLLTLVVLSILGWSERHLPTRRYARLSVSFKQFEKLSKDELYQLIKEHHIAASSPSYELDESGEVFHYQMTINTSKTDAFNTLSNKLAEIDAVKSFTIQPVGD